MLLPQSFWGVKGNYVQVGCWDSRPRLLGAEPDEEPEPRRERQVEVRLRLGRGQTGQTCRSVSRNQVHRTLCVETAGALCRRRRGTGQAGEREGARPDDRVPTGVPSRGCSVERNDLSSREPLIRMRTLHEEKRYNDDA